jgi:hypothetical protein
MEKIIKEDSHWWLWSQSTRRIDLEYPAGDLKLPQSQSERLASLFLVGQDWERRLFLGI